MNIKSLIIGILIGGILIGGVLWLINSKNSSVELFANKERCSIYTQKRQLQANEKGELLSHSISVEGFYSSVTNTCMTFSSEIAVGHYIQLTLIDELTGKTEAFAFEAMGKDLADLSIEAKQEQVKQNRDFHERLKYFQGIK
jgi:gas vesicle protein